MHHLLPVDLVIAMSCYNHNFGLIPANTRNVESQYMHQNVDSHIASQQKSQEIEQIKNGLLRERNTSAFTELFEDLYRYIQQEQNSSLATNISEYSQKETPVIQNESYEYNIRTPVQNIVQFPYNVPIQSTNEILPNHRGVVHHAHISFIPSTRGTLRTITKRKRKRTIFTTEQVEELEKYFSAKPYVTREDRQILANSLNINDKAVKIWFQNRRLKDKRDLNESPSTDIIINEYNSPEFSLDYIESQINEKTDQFGYVTLDDAMIGNLVNIVDRCLSTNSTNSTDGSLEEPMNECKSSPIYEPISPPDSTKDEENIHWQTQEHIEALQTLLDFQNIRQ